MLKSGYSACCRKVQCALQEGTVRAAGRYSGCCRKVQCALQAATVRAAGQLTAGLRLKVKCSFFMFLFKVPAGTVSYLDIFVLVHGWFANS